MRLFRCFALLVMLCTTAAAEEPAMDVSTVENFANLALHCVHQEYPNKIGHVMNSDDDVGAAARADAGLLRLFRLAQLGPRPLAADPADQALPGCGVRRNGAGGSRAEPEPGAGSPVTLPILPARGGPPTSGPTVWPGCSVSPMSSTPGTTSRRSSGRRISRRSKPKPRTDSGRGCPSSTTRSAPVSTARRPLLSV